MARNCSCSPTIAGDPATETESSAPDQPKQPCHDPKCSSRPASIRSTPAIDHLAKTAARHNIKRQCSCSTSIAGEPSSTNASDPNGKRPQRRKSGSSRACSMCWGEVRDLTHPSKAHKRPASTPGSEITFNSARGGASQSGGDSNETHRETAARHNIKRQCSCSTSIAGVPSSGNASDLKELTGEKPEIRITLPSSECSLCLGERSALYFPTQTQASKEPAAKTRQSEVTITAKRCHSSHSAGSAGADSNGTQGTQIITKPSVCERDINGEASGGFWLMPAIKRLVSPPTRIFPRRSLILTPPRGPRDGMGTEEIYNPRGDNIAEGLGITGLAGNNLGRGRSGISVTSSSETGDTDTKGDRKVKHWAHLFHAIAAMATITLILALWLHLNCRHGGETGTEEKVECYATPLDLWRMIYLYCLCFGTLTSYLVYVNLMCSKVVPLAHQVVSLSFTLCCHSRSII
jgi:hypothetical protein